MSQGREESVLGSRMARNPCSSLAHAEIVGVPIGGGIKLGLADELIADLHSSEHGRVRWDTLVGESWTEYGDEGSGDRVAERDADRFRAIIGQPVAFYL
jgi:hypothetical protein